MKAPKDRPPNSQIETKGTRRIQTIPAEVWLGTETEPGLVDYPYEQRLELLAEARENKGPMWGPPEWSEEDERRWRMTNSP